MEARARMNEVFAAVERMATGDFEGGVDGFLKALGENRWHGFISLCALAAIARTYFISKLGALPSDGGLILYAPFRVAGEDRTSIDQMPRGLVFTGRFMVAFANGDISTCIALYEAVEEVDDEGEYFSDCITEMLMNTVDMAKELAAA